jgi:hypothetical protein
MNALRFQVQSFKGIVSALRSSPSALRSLPLLHTERADQETPAIRELFDKLRRGLAGAMTGLSLDANQHRRWSTLSCLQGGCEFETVTGPDTIVMIRGRTIVGG